MNILAHNQFWKWLTSFRVNPNPSFASCSIAATNIRSVFSPRTGFFPRFTIFPLFNLQWRCKVPYGIWGKRRWVSLSGIPSSTTLLTACSNSASVYIWKKKCPKVDHYCVVQIWISLLMGQNDMIWYHIEWQHQGTWDEKKKLTPLNLP